MALKFLNKKGWHTGSLRNIENVWKAEQKHNAEQNKLEELRKQIQEERERAEFRQLQEQAGLVPKQERLDFLYESGLAVGKASSEVFKSLQAPPGTGQAASSSAAVASTAPDSSSSKAAAPGALFEDKPQSANDAWRKLHSDPLLLIRQREQEALSRIKNNPVQMAMIRKSVEAAKQKDTREEKGKRKKKKHKKKYHGESKYDDHSTKTHSDSDEMSDKDDVKRRQNKDHRVAEKHTQYSRSKYGKNDNSASENPNKEKEISRSERHNQYNRSKYEKHYHSASDEPDRGEKAGNGIGRNAYSRSERHAHHDHSKRDKDYYKDTCNSEDASRDKAARGKKEHAASYNCQSTIGYGVDQSVSRASSNRHGSGHTNRQTAPKLSEEERAARLREMQLNAELHDEQRWKRLKKASELDAKEVMKDKPSLGGSNFLDAAKKSIYGTEKGGSSTIEESVRRRTYYLQGGSAAEESNAFRR